MPPKDPYAVIGSIRAEGFPSAQMCAIDCWISLRKAEGSIALSRDLCNLFGVGRLGLTHVSVVVSPQGFLIERPRETTDPATLALIGDKSAIANRALWQMIRNETSLTRINRLRPSATDAAEGSAAWLFKDVRRQLEDVRRKRPAGI